MTALPAVLSLPIYALSSDIGFQPIVAMTMVYFTVHLPCTVLHVGCGLIPLILGPQALTRRDAKGLYCLRREEVHRKE
jgi:hypothetical protein